MKEQCENYNKEDGFEFESNYQVSKIWTYLGQTFSIQLELHNGTRIKIKGSTQSLPDHYPTFFLLDKFIRIQKEENLVHLIINGDLFSTIGSISNVEIIYPPISIDSAQINFVKYINIERKNPQIFSSALFCLNKPVSNTGLSIAKEQAKSSMSPEYHFHLVNKNKKRYKMKMSFPPNRVKELPNKSLEESFTSGKKELFWEKHHHGDVLYKNNESDKIKKMVYETCLKLKNNLSIENFSNLSKKALLYYPY